MNTFRPILTIAILAMSSFFTATVFAEAEISAGITATITTTHNDLCTPAVNEGSIVIISSGSTGVHEYSIDGGANWQALGTFTGLTTGFYSVLVRDTDETCTDDFGIHFVGCADDKVLQNGDAIYTCVPVSPDNVTLAIDRIQPFNDFLNAGTVFQDVSSLIQYKPFEWTTGDLGGAVFGVTYDENRTIYTGISSLYSIISPVNSADLISINATTGIATTIATLPGDWGIAQVEYQEGCSQLFAANLEDGIIYRYSTTGTLLSTFDPMMPDDGVSGLAPLGERLVGLSYNYAENRLYYTTWANDRIDNGERNTVRSVEIDPISCDFLPATDQLEIEMPFISDIESVITDYSHPVMDIEFNQAGTIMLLSETGYDSGIPLKTPHESRVLRYDGSSLSWTLENTLPAGNTDYRYEIGTIRDGTNALGGIDFGYGAFEGAGCTAGDEEYIVATGDALKGINCNGDGCIYGLQYMSIDGGRPETSVLLDIARDLGNFQKGFYGDVDVVSGCCPCACEPITFDFDVDMLCIGTESELCVDNIVGGDSPYSYEWGTGETTSCATVTPTAVTDKYYVTVTDNGGCFKVDSIGTSPDCAYDLSLSKVVTSSGPYSAGSTVTFEVTISNDGQLPSSTMQFTDNAPAGLVFQSDNSGTLTDVSNVSTGVYAVTNLNPGDSETVELTYTIAATATSGSLSNVALITMDDGDDEDSDPSEDENTDDLGDGIADDDEDTATVTISAYDLSLAKAVVSTGPYAAGGTVTFSITISNDGSIPSSTMQFTDTPPAGLTFSSDNSASNAEITSIGAGVYEVTNLGVGDTETLEISYTISATASGTLTNNAEITADDGNDEDSDPDSDSNTDDLGDGVEDDDEDDAAISLSEYDLAIDQVVTSSGPYGPGSTVTIDVTVTNEGQAPSSTMQFTAFPPAGFMFVSDDSGSNVEITSLGGGVYEVTNLAPGDTETVELTYTITPTASGPLTHVSEITTDDGNDEDSDPSINISTDDHGDTIPDDDEDEDTISLGDYDLSLSKAVVSTGPYGPGSTVTFAITISNDGELPSSTMQFTDSTPTGLTFLSDDSGANADVNSLGSGVYEVTNLAVGDTETVEITYTINAGVTSSITNVAEITSDDGNDTDSDPDSDIDNDDLGDGLPDDDEDTQVVSLGNYDLSLNKTVVSSGPFGPGGTVTFGITVSNDGELPSSTMQFTDSAPTGLTFSSDNSAANADVTSLGGGVYEVTNLAAGDSETVEITYTIDATVTTSLTNGAEITSDDGSDGDSDPDSDINNDDLGDGLPDDDEDTATIDLGNYDLSLNKVSVTSGPYSPGSNVTFAITVSNDGDLPSSTMQFTDTTPTGLTFVSDNSAANPSVTSLGAGVYEVTGLAAGDTETVELTYTIDPNFLGSLTNVGEITMDDGNDSDSDPDIDILTDDHGDGLPDDDEDEETIQVLEVSGEVGDYVWEDTNGNGIQDAGEPPVADMRVELRDGLGNLIAVTQTDSAGRYLFSDLPAGDYYIVFFYDDIYDVTYDHAGGNTETDSDVDESNGIGSTPIFSLDAGEMDLSFDFGVYQCIELGSYVWLDTNLDDIRNEFENGINGVRVDLYKRVGNNWIYYDHTYTGQAPNKTSDDGYFHFCVRPGEYYLDFKIGSNSVMSVDPFRGGDNERDSDITNSFGQWTTDSFTVSSGDNRTDFGGGFTASGTIGDFVWIDNDSNGKRDAGEAGLPGVTVMAMDMSHNLVGSTTTDNSGNFMLTLPANDYYLKFDYPFSYIPTEPHMGADDSMDSDMDDTYGPGTTGVVTVTVGEHEPNVDAGLIGTVLPVTWLGVDGYNNEGVNHVRWSLSSELNVSHYELQRSLSPNEIDFETVSMEYSEYNNSSATVAYTLTDVDYTKEVNYYRIKRYDLNGRSLLSEVVVIDNRNEEFITATEFNVYPNPAIDQINISLDLKRETEELSIDIIDQLGRRFKEGIVIDVDLAKGLKTYTVDVSTLPKGMYTLQARIDKEVLVKKVLLVSK